MISDVCRQSSPASVVMQASGLAMSLLLYVPTPTINIANCPIVTGANSR